MAVQQSKRSSYSRLLVILLGLFRLIPRRLRTAPFLVRWFELEVYEAALKLIGFRELRRESVMKLQRPRHLGIPLDVPRTEVQAPVRTPMARTIWGDAIHHRARRDILQRPPLSVDLQLD